LSKTYERRISKFGVLTDDVYAIPMPLIAQLGRNFNPSLQGGISGDELLEIACDKVRELQMEIGGRFVYLECEDIPSLTEFYTANGFRRISQEYLPKGELVRMMRYL
jgi:predicted GNAT family N-acyltransferase